LLPEISPDEVHKNILRCYRLRNRLDRKMLGWILILLEKKFAPALGSPRPVYYIMKNLQYEKTEAYEILMAARALPLIPHSADAFERGEISWAKLKQIALAVEEEGTEDSWLSFAKTHRPGELRAEVRDARRNKRKRPREEGRGLSNLTVTQTFKLTLEEQEILRRAFEKTSAAMKDMIANGLLAGEEGRRPTSEEVLLFISRQVLESDLFAKLKEGSERERAIYDILYQVCPACNSSHIHTEDGPVEVPHEHVARIEGKARKVEITREDLVKGEALPRGKIDDKKIPKGVELKVLARDLNACARCGKKLGIHLHHVIFRSTGGPNEVWNLTSVCEYDHACIHGGTLEVFMDPLGTLHWRSKADWIDLVLGDELKEFASVPPVTVVVAAQPARLNGIAPVPPNGSAPPAPANGASPQTPARMSCQAEGAVQALLKATRHTKEEARERVSTALRLLSSLGRAPTADEIFNTAYYGRLVEIGGKVRRCGKSGPENGAGGETKHEVPGKAPETPENRKTGDST
jgi:hypothetical protein